MASPNKLHQTETTLLFQQLSTYKSHIHSRGRIFIGINGFKGGTGNSYLAIALTAAAIQLGYKVAHVITHRECQNNILKELEDYDFSNSPLRVFTSVHEAIESIKTFDSDFVICDLPNGSYRGSQRYRDIEELLEPLLDVFLHPVTFETPFNHLGTLTNIQTEHPLPLHRRWVVPLCQTLNPMQSYGAVADFEEYSHIISNVILFERSPFTFNLNSPKTPIMIADEISLIRYEYLLRQTINIALCYSMEERLTSLNPYHEEVANEIST